MSVGFSWLGFVCLGRFWFGGVFLVFVCLGFFGGFFGFFKTSEIKMEKASVIY